MSGAPILVTAAQETPPDPLALGAREALLATPEDCTYACPLKAAVWGLPWWSSAKESAFQCRGRGFDPWSGN